MTGAERIALNRQAAILAGYTFTPLADGEQVTDPDGVHWGWLPAGAAGPDFAGDPRLWWGLVEGMARLAETRPGIRWKGPLYRPTAHCIDGSKQPAHWYVELELSLEDEEVRGASAGEAAVRGALAVAAALGLAPAAAPDR